MNSYPPVIPGGSWSMITFTQAGGSVYQDIAVAPQNGESYALTVWMRCSPYYPSECPISGTLVLYGLGVADDDRTEFRVTSTTWVPVVTGLDVKNIGHAGLRAQIYLSDTYRRLNVDAVASTSGP